MTNPESSADHKIRVLVVDDSSMMRKIITTALKMAPDMDVVGVAEDGLIAISKARELLPDVITLDIEMPNMDGITALTEIRKFNRTVPIIMFSTLTQRGAESTIQALTSGASDYVGKPTDVGDAQAAFKALQDSLIPKVRALFKRPFRHAATHGTDVVASSLPVHETPCTLLKESPLLSRPDAVVIGVSTGGPTALIDIFSQFKTPLAVPMFIVQHMPPKFTDLLAKRLAGLGPIPVKEAEHGEVAQAGVVYMAPGGFHLHLERMGSRVVMHTSQEPPENSCRPAADVLFRTAAKIYKNKLLGVVLTGMGSDGLRGAQEIVEAGGVMVVQDQESSVIWGMPGAVAKANLAHRILPLNKIAQEISSRCALST